MSRERNSTYPSGSSPRAARTPNDRRVEVEVLRRVDRGVRDADPIATLLGEAGAVEGVDLGCRGDDELARVLRHRDAVVLRQVAREDVRGRAEPPLLDARAHDVRDIRPHGLGDRRDVHGQARAPRRAHGVGHGDGVRAEVERQAHRRHAVGEELDEATGDAREVPAVGHLVVAHGLRTFDDDARTVRQHPIERFQRQARRLESIDRPGHDAHLVEAALQRGLGEVASLDRVTADHRVGAVDDDEAVAGRSVHGSSFPVGREVRVLIGQVWWSDAAGSAFRR
ncbi:hypothetical protein [Agromyces sp. GXQ0307]|uniref:hypothetical protein n=1 Tax=Agromyces sp. GXQ0307 TaxID=3377835 RepID=UPI00383A8BD2